MYFALCFALHNKHLVLVVVCAGLILAAGCANQTNDLSSTSPFIKSARRDIANLPNRIIEDSRETFSKTDNITALLLAGTASVVMHNSDADENLAENTDRHRAFGEFPDEGLYVVGNPWTHLSAAALWYAVSVDKQDEFNRQRALTMITALSTTGLVTMGLKAIRDNDTPNGKSWAWPSGHTASSFTVASVLDEFYGPKIGIPAYILACLVGWRMMDTGDHWGSDVVFGATLGWVVGHTIAGKHKKLEVGGFDILPYTASNDGPVIGVNLLKRF